MDLHTGTRKHAQILCGRTLTSTSIPHLWPPAKSPTLEVENSGLKKEIIFEIRALTSPHVA
jgi:hypothetical protein